MKMWLKRLTLLFLIATVTAMVISRQTSVCLNETQKIKKVPAGSNLTLNCCLNTTVYTRYRISWYFNKPGLLFTNSNKIFEKMISKPGNNSMDNYKDTQMAHILSDVNGNHSGWYFCKVTAEIPNLTESQSNGTEIVILDMHTTNTPVVTITKDPDVPSGRSWIWIVLGVSSFILLLLLVICVLLTRKAHGHREEPIYANTRNPKPSPRPGMSADSLKTTSSCQNLRTPSPGARYDEGKRRYKH